jgi:hypothetical protein
LQLWIYRISSFKSKRKNSFWFIRRYRCCSWTSGNVSYYINKEELL